MKKATTFAAATALAATMATSAFAQNPPGPAGGPGAGAPGPGIGAGAGVGNSVVLPGIAGRHRHRALPPV